LWTDALQGRLACHRWQRRDRGDEVADLALAILRNGYVTNHIFSVDGGMHPR
jgi:hypothetical protein